MGFKKWLVLLTILRQQPYNAHNFFIGCRGDITQCADGDIGEIVVFSRTLKDTEIASVEQYLDQKWGIY
jgi:hypothetical protein